MKKKNLIEENSKLKSEIESIKKRVFENDMKLVKNVLEKHGLFEFEFERVMCKTYPGVIVSEKYVFTLNR